MAEKTAGPMLQQSLKDSAERVYDAIYEEEDARVCKDISDSACSSVPQNFFLNASAVALGKLADALANTKTTLPWLLTSMGAPGWIAPSLAPIRESGSMLPQLAIGSWVRQAAIRKWFYCAGAIAQALSLSGIVLSAVFLQGSTAGVSILMCVIFFSLARGFCSVASKDVMGKTVPKTRRGRVNGLSASIAGFGTLIAAALLYHLQAGIVAYSSLIATAAVFWLLAAWMYGRIDEDEGAVEGAVNGLSEAFSSFALLRDDKPFRNFVIGRALLVGTALSAPFLVIMAQQRGNTDLVFFLIAQGSAALLSGHFWGKFADRSSRKLLLTSGVAAGTLGASIFFLEVYQPSLTHTPWFLPACFFVLMVLHDGVRLGRKTYLVDLGGAEKRTDYVALSNTLIGVVLLVAGAIASLVQTFGNAVAILLFSLLAFIACIFVYKLPEVQEE